VKIAQAAAEVVADLFTEELFPLTYPAPRISTMPSEPVVYEPWIDRAVGYVRLYATVHEVMLAEHCRRFAELDGFACPPDKRAWGRVMRNAAAQHIIQHDGYAPAESSNHSPKVKWRSLILQY
jgi:hypothetical protein